MRLFPCVFEIRSGKIRDTLPFFLRYGAISPEVQCHFSQDTCHFLRDTVRENREDGDI